MHYLKSFLIIGFIFAIFAACQASNEPLQANAGSDFSVKVDQAPQFDGCASTGNIVNYKWAITSAPDQMDYDQGKIIREVDANCSFTLDADMGVDEVGIWVIELEVSDSAGNTSMDTVEVMVES